MFVCLYSKGKEKGLYYRIDETVIQSITTKVMNAYLTMSPRRVSLPVFAMHMLHKIDKICFL